MIIRFLAFVLGGLYPFWPYLRQRQSASALYRTDPGVGLILGVSTYLDRGVECLFYTFIWTIYNLDLVGFVVTHGEELTSGSNRPRGLAED